MANHGDNRYAFDLQLLGELIRRCRRAIGLFAVRQSPWTLFTERQRQELSNCQLVFLAIRGNTDGDGVLRDVAT